MVVTDLKSGKHYHGTFVCFKDDAEEGLGKVISFSGRHQFFANSSKRWKVKCDE